SRTLETVSHSPLCVEKTSLIASWSAIGPGFHVVNVPSKALAAVFPAVRRDSPRPEDTLGGMPNIIALLIAVPLRQPVLFPCRRRAYGPGLSCAHAPCANRPTLSLKPQASQGQSDESHPCLPPPRDATRPALRAFAQCF